MLLGALTALALTGCAAPDDGLDDSSILSAESEADLESANDRYVDSALGIETVEQATSPDP